MRLWRAWASAVLSLAAAWPSLAGNWDPRLAANYLDQRQKEWFAWPPAMSAGAACVSCHTGMTYLLARPALRRLLGEAEPTLYEKNLVDALQVRVEKTKGSELFPAFPKEPLASQGLGVESILAALLLGKADPEGTRTRQAFDRMWRLQLPEGAARGAWKWFQLDLDPWETPESPFYGATLAALAAATSPKGYQEQPEIRKKMAELAAYLRDAQESQPLHNRAMLLWSGAEIRGLLSDAERLDLIGEIFRRQGKDGGWSVESAGPWKARPGAPVSQGSNAYITAFLTFALEKGGMSKHDKGVARALGWLASHQDPQGGYWEAESMNKVYPAGSMQSQFMRDAATGFAALALAEAGDIANR